MSEEQHIEDLILLAKLKDQQRKRQPSEKPQDGEVVLVSMEDGLTLGFYHHKKSRWLGIPGLPLLEEDRIKGWWSIKRLLKAGGVDHGQH